MARRARRRREGLHVPQLARGLRAHAAKFGPIRLSVLDRLDAGAPFPITGGKVWDGLMAVDPNAAEVFRARCGYQRGAASAWLAVDNTLWTFDPATATLEPLAE